MLSSAALICAGLLLALYALLVVGLLLAGRGGDARAWARCIPDCLVLLRRLLGDRRLPASRRLAVLVLLAYLAMPFDLIPDFVPVAGQLDDALLTALVLRFVLREAGPELLRQHWPGPPQVLEMILRRTLGADQHLGRLGTG